MTRPRLKETPWKSLIAAHKKLNIIPSFNCSGPQSQHVLDLVFHASTSSVPVNTIYSARPRKFNCIKEASSLVDYRIGLDELLIVLMPPFHEKQILGIIDNENLCKRFEGGIACTKKWYTLGREVTRHFSVFNPNIPKCEMDNPINFSQGGSSKNYTTLGWSEQGEWGTWTDGHAAGLICNLEKRKGLDIKLSALVHAFAPDNNPPQTVDVIVNSHKVSTWNLDHQNTREVSAIIHNANVPDQMLMNVIFRIAHPSSPSKHRISGDNRNLGIEVKWIKFEEVRDSSKNEKDANEMDSS
ncbi:MAG: hypothetical protein IT388_05530 [Nitrospirales bacterium]|nr:hypothetical protein [Nitrospirales bacterium]